MADSKDNTNDPADKTEVDGGLINLGKTDEPAADAAPEKADVEEKDADAVTTATVVPPAAKSESRPMGLLVALGVVSLLLIGLFVSWNPWFGPFNGSREVADRDDAEESAATSACEIANKLFSYDYSKIDDFFNAVQDSSTGRFGDGFVADKEQLRAMFEQTQVVSRAEETSCETQMIGDDLARVRMQGTQTVMSSIVAQGQEQTEHIDLYIDLQKTDGEWKVYDLSPAGSGSIGTGLGGNQPAPGLQPAPIEPPAPGAEEQPAPEEQTDTPN